MHYDDREIVSACPPGADVWIQQWTAGLEVIIKLKNSRRSKLGDYRRLSETRHQITVNKGLAPELTFFVLTHEMAHLLAFHRYGRAIPPHGAAWKSTFAELLLQSLPLFPAEMQPMILAEAKNPKANFLLSAALVRHFGKDSIAPTSAYIMDLSPDDRFEYRGHTYRVKQRLKKNYLCEQLETGRTYIFRPMASVEKL